MDGFDVKGRKLLKEIHAGIALVLKKKMRQMNSSLTELEFRSSILSFRSFSIIYTCQLDFRLVNSRDHLYIQHFFQHGGEVELYLKK